MYIKVHSNSDNLDRILISLNIISFIFLSLISEFIFIIMPLQWK